MSVSSVQVRSGSYHDSVSLMQVSRTVTGVDGVEAALVAMATELNLDVLAGMGFDPPPAGVSDLLVAVRAGDEAGIAAAHAAVDRALDALARPDVGSSAFGAVAAARTTAGAARRSAAPLALISVPGAYAFAEAMDALESGRSVMVFSDNVPVEQEVRLKDVAAERGLLVMGPDCGTAMVSGVGLGFANAVRPGPVGIVAASGTGAQQLMCLLDAAGAGVSACLGVGGRDLSAAVRGRSTRAALDLLDADPATELIVLVSKPPAEDVAAEVLAHAATLSTPVQVALLGRGKPDLTAAAKAAVEAAGLPWSEPASWPAPQQPTTKTTEGALRGLFAGGTLCDEAMVIASATVGPVRSNIPLEPDWTLPDSLRADGHVMVDFGDDRLTQGRPHPMIDQRSRIDRIGVEAADPEAGVILLDVVLGHGAHPDPAAELGPAIASALATARSGGRDLAVVVSLCGSSDDPQGLDRQARALVAAGASVHLSNAAAARAALALLAVAGDSLDFTDRTGSGA